MSRLAAVVLWLSLGNAEVLATPWRAVTLEAGQELRFRVQKLERVTGSSGKCIEEGRNGDEPEEFILSATCPGVRTTMVWKTDGSRLNVMACAEGDPPPPNLLKLRKQLQAEVRAWKSVTACVRNGHVELWGWVLKPAELEKLKALELKHGHDSVVNHVELVEE
jgi:hypothetical protein